MNKNTSLTWKEPKAGDLPPPTQPGGTHLSQLVWLALSDNRVVVGQCLYRHPEATYKAPVHDWFIQPDDGGTSMSISCLPGTKVVAWAPFEKPRHPFQRGTDVERASAAFHEARRADARAHGQHMFDVPWAQLDPELQLVTRGWIDAALKVL